MYTVGRNAQAAHLGEGPAALRALGAECIEVDRGGSVTFHGPGQMVGYPIIRLADAFPIRASPSRGDVVAYVQGPGGRADRHRPAATASPRRAAPVSRAPGWVGTSWPPSA